MVNGYTPKTGRNKDNIKVLRDKLNKMDESIEKWCMQLEITYQSEHMLIRAERSDYCEWGCDFLELKCGKHGSDNEFFISTDSLNMNSERLVKWASKHSDGQILATNITQEAIVDVKYVMKRAAPLVLSFPPLLMSRAFVNRYFPMCLYIILVLIAAYVGKFGWATTGYVVFVSGASAIFPVTAYYFNDAAVSVLILAFCMGSVLFTGVFMQVGAVVLIFGCYVLLLRKTFYDRKGNAMMTVMYLLQIAVCVEHLKHISEQYAPDTLGFHFSWMLVGTVFPQASKNSSYILWTINSAACVNNKVVELGLDIDGGLFLFIFIQAIAFLMFRSFYGMYIMRKLRFKTDIQCIFEGIYIYIVDVFGGLHAVSRMLTGEEKPTFRRIMYVAVGSGMTYFEIYNAVEVFYFRLLISVTDLVFIGSDYSKMSKYLGLEISFEHCHSAGRTLQSSFPQKGSVPWISIDDITKCCQYVKSISVTIGSRTFRGEGLITRNSKGKLFMLSVKHMFPSKGALCFDDVYFGTVTPRPLNQSDDPVVSIDLGPYEECGPDYANAPIIDNLTKDELLSVSTLAFLNSDEGNGGMINLTNQFRIDHRGNGFCVPVDLKKGDSGGAVLAVMRDGAIRYAGAVSKGSSDMNGGNFISWSVQTARDDGLSSDDDADNRLLDTERNRTFNIKRNRSFDWHGRRSQRVEASKQLNDFIFDNETQMSQVARLPYLSEVDDFKDLDTFNNMKSEIAMLEGARNSPQYGDDGDDSGHRSKKRKKTKSSNKDRATHKRRIIFDERTLGKREWKKVYDLQRELYNKLKLVFEEQEAINLFGIMLEGRFPEVRHGRFYYSPICDYVYDVDSDDESF